MNRNIDFKKTSLKFIDSKTARAQRVDQQNDSRRLNRLAKNNAKRNLVEIDQNTANLNSVSESNSVELTHDQKLRERLAKLKLWREQKVADEKKAKATKKVPFLVPGVARSEKMATEVASSSKSAKPIAVSARVTRSQVKKNGDVEKQWAVTENKPPTVKKQTKLPLQATKSFAPQNFVFSAPLGKISLLLYQVINLQFIFCFHTVLEATLKSGNDTPLRQKPSEFQDDGVKISPL